MFKRIALTLAVAGTLMLGIGSPITAEARGPHGRHHDHGRWHGHGHGHWHGGWRGPVVYPPVYYGGYYPVRTYYAAPYYYPPYGSYFGYYGSGTSISIGC
jgi:hypothetical protein